MFIYLKEKNSKCAVVKVAVLIVSSLLILNFDNPGIGQISFLASLDLVIEQMSVG